MTSFAAFKDEIEAFSRSKREPDDLSTSLAALDRPSIHERLDRPLLQLLTAPTPAEITNVSLLLNRAIESHRGEVYITIGPHNAHQDDIAALLDHDPPTSLSKWTITTSTVSQITASLKLIAAEMNCALAYTGSLSHAPSNTTIAPASANDEETTTKWASPVLRYLIRRIPAGVTDLLEIKMAACGNVDSGKSSTLGVLSKGRLDDGRGMARLRLLKHKHEIETGRTSSVGIEIMGFDAAGKEIQGDLQPSPLAPVNTNVAIKRHDLTWEEICKKSSKIVSFTDLAGHERYFKTTIAALAGYAPDYVLLIVGANAGIIGMSKEHLAVALSLAIPLVVVITKIDLAPAHILDSTLKQVSKILKSPGCRKSPVFVKDPNMACEVARNFVKEKAAPIFMISNVTGEGLDSLKTFLNCLPLPSVVNTAAPLEFSVSDVFSVSFVGSVVSGVLHSGNVKAGDSVLLGPDSLGQFIPTQIKSIERKRVRVDTATTGQSVAFALKKIRRTQLRKGMVLLSPESAPKATLLFEASVLVLYHNTTIQTNYQAMAHTGNVRQTVRIVKMDKDYIRTGDRAIIVFEFIKCPEYIHEGWKILFREGKTKGLGCITKLIS